MSLTTYNLISLDPSYRRTGVFTDNPVGTPFPHRKGNYSSITRKTLGLLEFNNLAEIAFSIRDEFVTTYCQVRYKIGIMEYPPPRGSMSPALYLLDVLFFEELLQVCDNLYLVPCNAIKSFLGKTSSKSDVVNYVKDGKKCPRLNHDEASAVVLVDIVKAKLRKKYRGVVYEYSKGKAVRL